MYDESSHRNKIFNLPFYQLFQYTKFKIQFEQCNYYQSPEYRLLTDIFYHLYYLYTNLKTDK